MKKYETPDVEYIEFYSTEELTSGEGETSGNDPVETPDDWF